MRIGLEIVLLATVCCLWPVLEVEASRSAFTAWPLVGLSGSPGGASTVTALMLPGYLLEGLTGPETAGGAQ